MQNNALKDIRLLVVDDDPDFVEAMKELFKNDVKEFLIARDGNEAIAVAKKENPDVILLDAMLPKRSGFLVLENLKGRKSKTDKPHVIIITANEGKRYQECAEAFGSCDFITKPAKLKRIHEAVENAAMMGINK